MKKTKLFIILALIVAMLALSSCGNAANEPSEKTEPNTPSQSESESWTEGSDEPSQSESLRKDPETEYERIAYEYIENCGKALHGAIDGFDGDANTLGSLGSEERNRIIDDILQKDSSADISQIEAFRDFSYFTKHPKALIDYKPLRLEVTNYSYHTFIEGSKSDKSIAHVTLIFCETFHFLDCGPYEPGDPLTEMSDICDVYLYKYGETWLIYSITSCNWAEGMYLDKTYVELYKELAESLEEDIKREIE